LYVYNNEKVIIISKRGKTNELKLNEKKEMNYSLYEYEKSADKADIL
jgi:hypothetical protein